VLDQIRSRACEKAKIPAGYVEIDAHRILTNDWTNPGYRPTLFFLKMDIY